MNRRTNKKSKEPVKKVKKATILNGEGKFNFPNGDFYEGQYIVVNSKEIYRHGYGIYTTKDNDKYCALWDNDSISSHLHVRYGNNAEFCGEVDTAGAMSGKGTYIFPDRTKLTAIWKNNEPVEGYEYEDPLKHYWLGKLSLSKTEIIFAPENRIWDEKFVR